MAAADAYKIETEEKTLTWKRLSAEDLDGSKRWAAVQKHCAEVQSHFHEDDMARGWAAVEELKNQFGETLIGGDATAMLVARNRSGLLKVAAALHANICLGLKGNRMITLKGHPLLGMTPVGALQKYSYWVSSAMPPRTVSEGWLQAMSGYEQGTLAGSSRADPLPEEVEVQTGKGGGKGKKSKGKEKKVNEEGKKPAEEEKPAELTEDQKRHLDDWNSLPEGLRPASEEASDTGEDALRAFLTKEVKEALMGYTTSTTNGVDKFCRVWNVTGPILTQMLLGK